MEQNITNDPDFKKFLNGMQPQMPNIDPNVLSKVPGIQNVQLANAPTFSPEGVATYPEIRPTISAPPPQVAQVQPQMPQAADEGGGFFSSVGDIATKIFAPSPSSPTAPSGGMMTGGSVGTTQAPVQSIGEMATSARQAIPMGLPGSLPFNPEAPTASPQDQSPFGLADPSSSTAPTGEDPFAGPINVQAPVPRADPNQQIRLADPTSSTVGGLTTQSGIPLSQFLSGAAIPEAGYAAESPMYAENSQSRGLTGQVGRDAFAQASLDREARQEQMLQSRAQSREDQRGGASKGGSAPTALFKKEAEANGLTGRAKSDYISEKTRVWGEAKEDREIAQASGKAAATREKIKLGLEVSAEERAIVKREDERLELRDQAFRNIRATQQSFDKLKPVADEIAKLSGGITTEGGLGWVASTLPFATDAKQIDRLSKELEGTTFLQGLIEAKANGATFGALSEREGDRILAARGKLLSPSSTNEERIAAVNAIMDTVGQAVDNAQKDYDRKYGKDDSAPSGSSSGKDDSAPSGSSSGQRYSNDQDHGAKVESYFQG